MAMYALSLKSQSLRSMADNNVCGVKVSHQTIAKVLAKQGIKSQLKKYQHELVKLISERN